MPQANVSASQVRKPYMGTIKILAIPGVEFYNVT